MDSIKGMKRTHMCGQLSEADISKEVVVMGWVQRVRDLGGLIFVDLRDRSGILQLVMNEKDSDIYEIAEKIRPPVPLRYTFRICAYFQKQRHLPLWCRTILRSARK